MSGIYNSFPSSNLLRDPQNKTSAEHKATVLLCVLLGFVLFCTLVIICCRDSPSREKKPGNPPPINPLLYLRAVEGFTETSDSRDSSEKSTEALYAVV
ncbi:hypothetical protein DID78_04030 [Candidatus Marinamargulisbacteria bacterium SCGC AG-343-D04]|nr:hypothetical protein DID78_04030 [Candidatus Marinamargulisbacteria bacterium SCGC AG-343-D04]